MNSKKLVAAACLSVAFTALANGFPQDAYAWSKLEEVRKHNMMQHGAVQPRYYGYTEADTDVPSRSVADWVKWLDNATSRKPADLASIVTEIKGDHGLNARDNHNWTALMATALRGYTEITSRLIEAGADVNDRGNHNWTALMVAANKGSTESVRLLIDAKADLNARDDRDSTALVLAAGQGHTEIARMLIEAGANVRVKDQYDRTAYDLAMERGRVEMAKALTDQTKNPKDLEVSPAPILTFTVTGKDCGIRGNVINISAGVNPSAHPLPNGCALTPRVGY